MSATLEWEEIGDMWRTKCKRFAIARSRHLQADFYEPMRLRPDGLGYQPIGTGSCRLRASLQVAQELCEQDLEGERF